MSVGKSSKGESSQDLLQLILDSTPAAIVVIAETGTIAFTNAAARELFFEGREAKGENFLRMLGQVSEPLRRALLSETDQIFTFEQGGDTETFHLAKSHVPLDGKPHVLVNVRHLTQEIARQEAAVLKKTLRTIGHELGNSMAPAASLLRTARLSLSRPEMQDQLGTMLETVEERLQHLQGFLSGLSALGRLPSPRKQEVAWPSFLDGLRGLWPEVSIAPAPTFPGWFDPAQIQQVLINLVKNAFEAGGPQDGVAIDLQQTSDGGVRFAVLDRGPGMSDAVMARALLPAFTTKPNGSGIGLSLCHEIIGAHDGRLRIGRREGSGTVVSFWLPPQDPVPGMSRARLTLTGVP